jgi:hypothetical protein
MTRHSDIPWHLRSQALRNTEWHGEPSRTYGVVHYNPSGTTHTTEASNMNRIKCEITFYNPSFRDNTGDWQTRHTGALRKPRGFEAPIVGMISAWAQYADTHRTRYESPIGADGVLGPEWQAIGVAILGLLNGECGRLDCGTLDGFIRDTLTSEGCNGDS